MTDLRIVTSLSDLPAGREDTAFAESPSDGSALAVTVVPGDRRKLRRGPVTLLIGTALSVRQLVPSLMTVEPAPILVGCLLPKPAILPLAVLGGFDQLETVAGRPEVQEILVSVPAVMAAQLRDLAERLNRLGKPWRYLPPLADQLAGVRAPRLTDAAVDDESHNSGPSESCRGAIGVDTTQLINRRPRPLDEAAISSSLAGKVVMITGAGGSIGAELALIAARFKPQRLILIDRSENALFDIDRQIGLRFPQLARRAVLHDVTQRDRTEDLMGELEPAVVFHAAAHKHVPMMEDHPCAAVENNFYGTRSIADAAHAAGCERFVMISTDKAVNPSSVMGATKRLAELYIRDLNRRSSTTFCMVRFGNVLGSACSLIPIWSDQLARGGPLTVTHPEMTRYFMTIPEAAGLVLQAGAYAGQPYLTDANDPQSGKASAGGEVFLLDMGQPIRIVEMAHRFLRLQGLAPDVDVKIKITGPRRGEKLYEELAYGSEDMLPTPHASIRLWRTDNASAAQMQQIVNQFDRLRDPRGDERKVWRETSASAIVTALRLRRPGNDQRASGMTYRRQHRSKTVVFTETTGNALRR